MKISPSNNKPQTNHTRKIMKTTQPQTSSPLTTSHTPKAKAEGRAL